MKNIVQTKTPVYITLEDIVRLAKSEKEPHGHRLVELHSLGFHQKVVEHLLQNPKKVMERARQRVSEWLDGEQPFAGSKAYALAWQELLNQPVNKIIDILLSDTPKARALRQTTPFAGEISEEEREEVIRVIKPFVFESKTL
jgi:hypothetical protein